MRTISTEQALQQQRLVDDVLRAYVDWREECEEVWSHRRQGREERVLRTVRDTLAARSTPTRSTTR
jgi:hypothetical protein